MLLAISHCYMSTSLKAQIEPARLSGTFLQLTSRHNSWTEAQWSSLFGSFRRLQLSELVVQWAACDEATFYARSGEPPAPLNRVLAAAARSEIRVWIGLYSESTYWDRIHTDAQTASVYLHHLRSRSLSIARDLAPVLSGYQGFAGWYLSEEVDDVNWQGVEFRKSLMTHLAAASRALHDLVPGSRVAISTFSNAQLSPGHFQKFWKEILQSSSLDTLFLQDGVGVHKLALDEFPIYADALVTATRAAKKNLSIVVELFEQVSGPPIDSGDFKAVPAQLARVRRQLEIARRFTNSITAFSVPEYMSPLGLPGAERLYHDYLGEYAPPEAEIPAERSMRVIVSH
jgi:hypothetical protein